MITPQVIGSAGVGVSTSRQFIGAAFRNFNQPIQKLFVNGEQGFFYDPNDLSTMFQDYEGTSPVTAVGQPVGIILDKRKGLVLGPELFNQVINFSTWASVAGGMGASGNTFTSNGPGGYFKSLTAIGVSPTKTYQVRIVGTCTVAHVIGNRSNNAGSFETQAGDFDITVVAPRLFSGPSLYFYLQGTGTMTVNSISIKELAGNHAYQDTPASRPILRDAPRRIDFDAVDDKPITKLPAQLTGCTVIRSVPSVGTQILTGQTILATYVDNADHCGLIVINRALTPSETSAITAEFNKRAGV